jgi:hypothetical protein
MRSSASEFLGQHPMLRRYNVVVVLAASVFQFGFSEFGPAFAAKLLAS